MLNYRMFLDRVNFSSIVILFVVLFLSLTFSPIKADASQPIKIFVNERHLATDVAPVLRNGRVFVPARAIANAFSMDMRFFPEYRAVALWNNTLSISLNIGHDAAILTNAGKNMREVSLGSPIFVHNGRTMIPLRFVAESFGVSVAWMAESRTVIISSPRPALPVKGTAYLPSVQSNPERRRMTPEEVIALVEPATVQIQIHSYMDVLRGSGFLISPDGLVLTNAHVARGIKNLYVALKTGERFPAQIIKINNRSDLALLRIANDAGRTFPYIRHRAYRSAVFAGDTVLSFGNPGSRRWFVSEGIVVRSLDLTLAPAWTKNYPLIIHNAYTDVGSSGGVVVNLYGEWIGVNALGGVDEELGFAVPADYLYELLDGTYFSLSCDWDSYWTEMFRWQGEVSRAEEAFNRELHAQKGSQYQANAWREALAITENIRFFPQGFTPFFPELFHLPRLFIATIDARIDYYSYHVNTLDGRVLWVQEERDRLWNNIELALNEYNTEFQRVSLLVGNKSAYKAVLP